MNPRRTQSRMLHALAISAVLIVVSACSSGPSKAEIDLEKPIAADLAKIRNEPLVGGARYEVPGAQAGLALDGSEPVEVSDGHVDVAKTAEVGDDSVFFVGSVTKTFTSALVLKLAQDDKLSLDDPISKYVEYPNGDKITVKDCLAQESGIPDFETLPDYKQLVQEGASPEQVVAGVAALNRSNFAPGQGWGYSNTNYLIAGIAAQKAGGDDWAQQIEDNFIGPLGLDSTSILDPVEGKNLVQGYGICDGTDGAGCTDGLKPIDTKAPKLYWAAGAIVSNGSDLATWIRALASGKVLDAEHTKLMLTPTAQSAAGVAAWRDNRDHVIKADGLGMFEFELDGVKAYGHDGLIAGTRAIAVYAPDATAGKAGGDATPAAQALLLNVDAAQVQSGLVMLTKTVRAEVTADN